MTKYDMKSSEGSQQVVHQIKYDNEMFRMWSLWCQRRSMPQLADTAHWRNVH